MLCIEELNVKFSKLDDRSLIVDSIYCEIIVNIFSLQNNGLHVVLEGEPVIILTTLFCFKKTFLLSAETPQNDAILHN
jgi:hypothetical protein